MKNRHWRGILVLLISLLSLLVVLPTTQAAGSSQVGFTRLGASGALENQADAPLPVVLTEAQNTYPLGLNLPLLEDPTGELTIDEVSSPVFEEQFIPNLVQIPNIGYRWHNPIGPTCGIMETCACWMCGIHAWIIKP